MVIISDIQFSVIVPIFNVGKHLRQCVDSILSSTYDNYELILVDDGSTDECGIICDEYSNKDSRIRVLHKENGGLVSARQAGLQAATGEYICCVDGDDYVSPYYLDYFAKKIVLYNPDIITCDYFGAYPDKQILHKQKFSGLYCKQKIEEEIFPLLLCDCKGNSIAPNIWAKAFKKSFYYNLQMNVDQSLTISEDAAVTRPAYYLAESVYFGNACNYYYRINSASMTRDGRVLGWDLPKKILSAFDRTIDFSEGDFNEQLLRYLVHFVFDVTKSQFNSTEMYHSICKNIEIGISDPLYQKAIREANYSIYSKGYWAQVLLQRRMYWSIKLFNNVNKHLKA